MDAPTIPRRETITRRLRHGESLRATLQRMATIDHAIAVIAARTNLI